MDIYEHSVLGLDIMYYLMAQGQHGIFSDQLRGLSRARSGQCFIVIENYHL